MKINNDYVHAFSLAIQEASDRNGLKGLLVAGRQVRVESGHATHFWELSQRKVHQAFDRVYAQGVKKLAETSSSRELSLDGRVSSEALIRAKPLISREGKGKVIKAGIGFGVGGILSAFYSSLGVSTILHENGHAFALNQMYVDANPVVSVNALYWISKGEWLKWFLGESAGAPGNWTNFGQWPATLNDVGQALSPVQRDLLFRFGGLGAELVVNSGIAVLGLIAMRCNHRFLGSALLMFSLVSHLIAHDYIRSFASSASETIDPSLLHWDPLGVSKDLAEFLHCSIPEAFNMLWYAYLLIPIGAIATIGTFLLKRPEVLPHLIPDECILLRLLSQNDSPELKELMAEVEVEMAQEYEELERLDQQQKDRLIQTMSNRLITKIKGCPATLKLFKETRTEIVDKIKGKMNVTTSLGTRLAIAAWVVSYVAYQILSAFRNIVPIVAEIFHHLSIALIGLQGVCTLIDIVKLGVDVLNNKLSSMTKALTASRTLLSMVSLSVIIAGMCVPGLNMAVLGTLIACGIARLILFLIDLYIKRQEAILAVDQLQSGGMISQPAS